MRTNAQAADGSRGSPRRSAPTARAAQLQPALWPALPTTIALSPCACGGSCPRCRDQARRFPLQPQLEIGAPDDEVEREADRVADQVMRMPEPGSAISGLPRARCARLVQRQREARITVATSVQANRPTFPVEGLGQLTTAFLAELRRRRTSVAEAAERAGAGTHRFGRPGGGGEEREGFSVGQTTAAPAEDATRRAVVIGNSNYVEGRTMGATVESTRDLDDVPRDVARVIPVLRDYQVTSLADRTGPQIEQALSAALAGLTPGSELLLYFNGHGTIEGLIGVDGSVFTPAEAGAVQDAARAAGVDFTMILEGCHTGTFVDFLRGRELGRTRDAAQQLQQAAAPDILSQLQANALAGLLDAAIELQEARSRYNAAIQTWWARRFEIEQQMNADLEAGVDHETALQPWEAHFSTRIGPFNTLVQESQAPIGRMLANSFFLDDLDLPFLQLHQVADGGQSVDNDMQGQLDDMTTVLNEILRYADTRLAPLP